MLGEVLYKIYCKKHSREWISPPESYDVVTVFPKCVRDAGSQVAALLFLLALAPGEQVQQHHNEEQQEDNACDSTHRAPSAALHPALG
ncbi:hypothetical protein QTO34_016957 [Cnephaeus nilssonii]|uniref:Uncharacterized protein n=1 Tax=Cnephaeus nilssonii TaxID=3371016 RepID=A0AA40I476_CNENI|nr:hypothetical protein QTO34_016957 [Eptesicus nilssonii]